MRSEMESVRVGCQRRQVRENLQQAGESGKAFLIYCHSGFKGAAGLPGFAANDVTAMAVERQK